MWETRSCFRQNLHSISIASGPTGSDDECFILARVTVDSECEPGTLYGMQEYTQSTGHLIHTVIHNLGQFSIASPPTDIFLEDESIQKSELSNPSSGSKNGAATQQHFLLHHHVDVILFFSFKNGCYLFRFQILKALHVP